MTDYRDLLIRYIRHVMDCEGSDFIEDHVSESGTMWPGTEVKFTKEEAAALVECAKAARK